MPLPYFYSADIDNKRAAGSPRKWKESLVTKSFLSRKQFAANFQLHR